MICAIKYFVQIIDFSDTFKLLKLEKDSDDHCKTSVRIFLAILKINGFSDLYSGWKLCLTSRFWNRAKRAFQIWRATAVLKPWRLSCLVAGLEHEGIFRINGNARVVERIKASFERTGDADLSDAGDMMAVAGVLKLFLRELPDAVIPEHMTKLFVNTQEG